MSVVALGSGSRFPSDKLESLWQYSKCILSIIRKKLTSWFNVIPVGIKILTTLCFFVLVQSSVSILSAVRYFLYPAIAYIFSASMRHEAAVSICVGVTIAPPHTHEFCKFLVNGDWTKYT